MADSDQRSVRIALGVTPCHCGLTAVGSVDSPLMDYSRNNFVVFGTRVPDPLSLSLLKSNFTDQSLGAPRLDYSMGYPHISHGNQMAIV